MNMPWCPKCKNEYREGFTECAECGCRLVESIQPEEAEQPAAEHFEDQVTTISEEADMCEEYMCEEALAGQEKTAGCGTSSTGAVYQDSAERADENRSSAWVLLIVGALGLTAVVLGAAGVLPIRFGNSYLFYGGMGAVFILFLVSGAMSMKSARIFAKKAESENSLKSTLQEWCAENLRGDQIDLEIGAGEDSAEILYFRRVTYIKERLNHQFVNLDQDFLDKFIDDCVYETVFKQESE